MQVISGLIVSIDAFFIGLSLGLQKGCRFAYLIAINIALLGLCLIGFFAAGRIYEYIPFETDLIVGICFIVLGLCYILQSKRPRVSEGESRKTIILVGLVMSIEAMLITMGITFVFLPYSTLAIPITVALAHFCYSSLSFWLARSKHVKRIPTSVCHFISGGALIIYGLMALFVEIF